MARFGLLGTPRFMDSGWDLTQDLWGGANLWVVRVSTEMSIPDLFIGFTVDDVNGFVNRFRTETKIQQMVSSFLRKDFASAHFFPNSINNNSKGSLKE